MSPPSRRLVSRASFVPDQEILSGDETDRLHRWGYSHYRQMFSARQLLGLELSCRLISKIKDERVRHALATNLSDLLRYQNLLCRYDTWALKSLDIFSVHGFPVGHVQCESNLLGIVNGTGANVGSGGWTNIVDKYTKASRTGKRRPPVRQVHNDYTERSAPRRLADLLGADAGAAVRRFAVVNVWRPIKDPVETAPLALADARSVAPEDFVAVDLVYPDRTGEIYHAAWNPRHRWVYYPRMSG